MEMIEKLEILRDEYLETLDEDLMDLPPLIKVISDNLNLANIFDRDIDLYELLTKFIEAIKYKDLDRLPLLVGKSFDSIEDLVEQLNAGKEMVWRQYKYSSFENGSLVLADGSCILNFQNRGIAVAKDISGSIDNWNKFSYVLCSLSPNFKDLYSEYFKMEFDYLLKDNDKVKVSDEERDKFISYILNNVYCNSHMSHDDESCCIVKVKDKEILITKDGVELEDENYIPSRWCKFILAYKNELVVKVILYKLLGVDIEKDSDIEFRKIVEE